MFIVEKPVASQALLMWEAVDGKGEIRRCGTIHSLPYRRSPIPTLILWFGLVRTFASQGLKRMSGQSRNVAVEQPHPFCVVARHQLGLRETSEERQGGWEGRRNKPGMCPGINRIASSRPYQGFRADSLSLPAIHQGPWRPAALEQARSCSPSRELGSAPWRNTGWTSTASCARTVVDGPSLELQTARLCYPSGCVAGAESGRCNPSKDLSETPISDSDLQ